jgi:5S rRNA maturation endonuclease (ribonuclease M5)
VARFTDDLLSEIKDALSVSALVSRTHKLKKDGKDFRAIDDNSLTVSDAKQIWWDQSKNRGGTIFEWIRETQGLSFDQAVEECAKIAGVRLPGSDSRSSRGNGTVHHTDKNESAATKKGSRRIAKTYDYTDAEGSLLYQVVRFEPKGFAQRRRSRGADDDPADGDGWIWNLHGVEHGLYRLVEFRELAGQDDLVYLPEGEKDVDTLFAMGLAATTNSGGARNWRADHAELFRDRDVVVLVDHDDAGKERGKTIATTLTGIARSVRVVDIAAATWPGAPKGADITDWTKSREGTIDELLEVVKATPIQTPPPFVSKFGARRWEEIATEGKMHYRWVVEDIIPEGEAVLLFGESGTGKSFDAFDLAMSVARGIKFNGFNVMKGLVIYAAAEAGKGFEKRKIAYVTHQGIAFDDQFPFVLLTRKFDLFKDDQDADALIEEIKGIKALYPDDPLRLIFIDTLSATTPGMNENASQDIGPVKARMDRVRVTFDAATVLVHHKAKTGNAPRGHTSLVADFETAIEFATTDLRDDNGRKVHSAKVTKQREGKAGMAWRFTLPPIEVGMNQWGNPETSCAVQVVNTSGQAVKGYRATDTEIAVLQAIAEATDEHGVPRGETGLGNKIPPAIYRVCNVADVRPEFNKRMIRDDDDDAEHGSRVRMAWSRATKGLRKAKVIGYSDPFIWWSGRPVVGFSRGIVTPNDDLVAKAEHTDDKDNSF